MVVACVLVVGIAVVLLVLKASVDTMHSGGVTQLRGTGSGMVAKRQGSAVTRVGQSHPPATRMTIVIQKCCPLG